MELIYKTEIPVTTALCDCFGRLKPSALLALMQEAAGAHCTSLQAGWDQLRTRGLFWAVARQSVELQRLPHIGERLYLETWPGEATRAAYPRFYQGSTVQGEPLFRAAALWLLMDLESRAMVVPGSSGVQVPGLLRGGELALPVGLAPAIHNQSERRTVRFSELDCNGHMSNTRYLDWMTDLLPGEFHRTHGLSYFRISYLSEAREGEQVDLSWDLDPTGGLLLEGRRPGAGSPDRVFALQARFDLRQIL